MKDYLITSKLGCDLKNLLNPSREIFLGILKLINVKLLTSLNPLFF